MNKLISLAQRAPKATVAVLAMVAAAVIIPTSLFAWGPSRPEYTIEDPAKEVVFNSITNNPSHGDERNFVQVRDASASNSTYSDSVSLKAGHEYVVYVYFHNNASSSLNASGVGIAHGSYVKAEIPAIVENDDDAKAVGYVGASNAHPAEVWDDITFKNDTDADIALRYVSGSAIIHSNGDVNGDKLSDNIITSGASIGYDDLDGELPGCNEYAGYVTFRVTADQPAFTISKQVRISGTATWSETVAANVGDTVDYLITYKNTGTTVQNDVVIKDTLPAGISLVKDTTYVANDANPKGTKVSDGIVNASGINIGNYAADANAYIKFSAKVADNAALATCGVNTLTNTAKAETNNGSKEDTAIVTVTKTGCTTTTTTTPTELSHTGPADTILSILGLGTLVTTAGYYVASRRSTIGR